MHKIPHDSLLSCSKGTFLFIKYSLRIRLSISLESRQFENIIFVVHTFFFGTTPSVAVKALICTSLMRGQSIEGFSFSSSDSTPMCWNGIQSTALHSLSLNYTTSWVFKGIFLPKARSVPGTSVSLEGHFHILKKNWCLLIANLGIFLCHFPLMIYLRA